MNDKENDLIIKHTDNWVKQVIMKYNICPFARQEVERASIRYVVFNDKKLNQITEKLICEFKFMDNNPSAETSLVILPNGFGDFNRYLETVYLAEDLIIEMDYEGEYQIASFHPDYCFEDEDFDSPTNFTNRSPYPTLHIIREASIEEALKTYDSPESIPERNKKFADKKGAEFFNALLKSCVK